MLTQGFLGSPHKTHPLTHQPTKHIPIAAATVLVSDFSEQCGKLSDVLSCSGATEPPFYLQSWNWGNICSSSFLNISFPASLAKLSTLSWIKCGSCGKFPFNFL